MALSEENKREFGRRLAMLREPRPQRVIAAKVGITERAYRDWESGKSEPQYDNLERLAEVLGVSENFLLYGSDTPPQNLGSQLDQIEQQLGVLVAAIEQLSDRMDSLADHTGLLTEADRQILSEFEATLARLGRDIGRGRPQSRGARKTPPAAEKPAA